MSQSAFIFPVEILLEIFEHYTNDNAGRIEHLLLVCKLWNEVVAHTSSLWAHIFLLVTPNPTDSRTPRFLLRRTSHFIEKSANLPLDIEMDLGGLLHELDYDAQDYEPILDLLYSNITRWRSLYITLPIHWKLSHRLCEFLKGSAPNLVEFSLTNFNWRLSQNTLFTDLPSLKVLTLESGFTFKEMISKFSLDSLESLDIDLHGFEMWNQGVDAFKWTSDVSLARSLRTLKIRCSRVGGATWYKRSLEDPLVLPSLQQLEIYKVGRIEGIRWDVPSLQTLIFDAEVKSFPDLAKVNPTRVVWQPNDLTEVRQLSLDDSGVQFLKGVIRQYTTTRRFIFPLWAQGTLIDALESLGAYGRRMTLSLDGGVCTLDRLDDQG